jgi:acetate kinase
MIQSTSVRILVLNSGSSSLKFQVMEITPDRDQTLAKGMVSKIGSQDATLSFSSGGAKSQITRPISNHDDALSAAFDLLKQAELDNIVGVGHRVVHGGEHFQESVVITDEVIRCIEEVSSLAPLHNPHNLKGYFASRALLPEAIQVAVFDTAFHQTLPPKAFLYGIPYEYYSRDKIRRYGFHGTSHRYLCGRFAEMQGKAPDASKLITCHLGNGCSICAIDRGKSIDTSMGFTPLEGLLMGTRSGDLDPGAVMFLADHRAPDAPPLEALLNESSGLLGLSGVSNDMHDLLDAEAQGNQRAELALQVFCYRVTKYIGAYFVALGGADAVIFSAGIGENAPAIRARICEPLAAIGIRLDEPRNLAAIGKEATIGAEDASPRVFVIPANEELLIARDTMRLIMELRKA